MSPIPAPSTQTKPLARRDFADPDAPVRIVPLGGVGEFGMNMMCYEVGDERIVVDCGAMFPDVDMLGVDLVIPDVSFLTDEPEKFKGYVLTHGHDDHIGALPYILPQLPGPIYATRMTRAILQAKLDEFDLPEKPLFGQLEYRQPLSIGGNFEVLPFHVSHSIPDSVALAIHTPAGVVVHTGDYKIDYAPTSGEPFDFYTLTRLGEAGVLALVGDSTNAFEPGSTQTERWVAEGLAPIFASSPRSIFCSTFSTSIHRLQVLLDLGVQTGRRIFIVGRSLERNVGIATELGYLRIPSRNMASIQEIENVPPSERLIIATGSQGEPKSVMSRLALGDYPRLDVEEDDTVILSARVIPGNARAINRMINHFFRRGARVYDSQAGQVHASGHAYSEEIKTVISMARPQFLIPVHGEIRQLMTHRQIAVDMGFDPEAIYVLDDGDVLEVEAGSALLVDHVPTGHVLVDGKTIGETGEVVLRDRQHLSEDGMLIAILNVDRKTGQLVNDPEIVTRGFVYVDESEELIEALRQLVRETFEAAPREEREEAEVLNTEVRRALRRYIRKNFDRFPLILPVVQEI